MVPYDKPIYGFFRERVCTHFLVVEAHTSYNILLGRPSLNTLGAIVSTPHLHTLPREFLLLRIKLVPS